MFDKLVESTSTGAELKPRRRIFAGSFFLVAILFATAVVASIYAADFDLGNENFDIAELLSPIAETEPQPEPERETPRNDDRQTRSSTVPVRQMLMASTQDPTRVPTTTSTAVNPYRSLSPDQYNFAKVGGADLDPAPAGPGGSGNGSGMTSALNTTGSGGSDVPSEPPPPVKAPERNPPPQSLGVVNGRAADLPKPPYPPPARLVGAEGPVNVQVMINEEGRVVSAKAVSGHPLLRKAAEDAAKRARFTTTYLSNVPVKVTGVIIYNFKKY